MASSILPMSGAAMDLGLGADTVEKTAEMTEDMRKRRKQLESQQKATGISPFMGAFQSLLSPTGNQY